MYRQKQINLSSEELKADFTFRDKERHIYVTVLFKMKNKKKPEISFCDLYNIIIIIFFFSQIKKKI